MKKILKIAGIIIIVFIVMGILAGGSTNKTTDNNKGQTNVSPTEKADLQITNEIIKKTASKYRYFFNIKNLGDNQFTGEIKIVLINSEGNKLAEDTFNADSGIESNVGKSVYIEANTGPESVHGEYGISQFEYQVISDGNTIDNGTGKITDKLEDL